MFCLVQLALENVSRKKGNTYPVDFALRKSRRRALRNERAIDDGHECECAEEATENGVYIDVGQRCAVDRAQTLEGFRVVAAGIMIRR